MSGGVQISGKICCDLAFIVVGRWWGVWADLSHPSHPPTKLRRTFGWDKVPNSSKVWQAWSKGYYLSLIKSCSVRPFLAVDVRRSHPCSTTILWKLTYRYPSDLHKGHYWMWAAIITDTCRLPMVQVVTYFINLDTVASISLKPWSRLVANQSLLVTVPKGFLY